RPVVTDAYPDFTSAFGAQPTWRDMQVTAPQSKVTHFGRTQCENVAVHLRGPTQAFLPATEHGAGSAEVSRPQEDSRIESSHWRRWSAVVAVYLSVLGGLHHR